MTERVQVKGMANKEGGNEEVKEKEHKRDIEMDNKEVEGSKEVEDMQHEEVEDRGLKELRQ